MLTSAVAVFIPTVKTWPQTLASRQQKPAQETPGERMESAVCVRLGPCSHLRIPRLCALAFPARKLSQMSAARNTNSSTTTAGAPTRVTTIAPIHCCWAPAQSAPASAVFAAAACSIAACAGGGGTSIG